ncbi:MAG TPA: flagellar basal body P-ring formation chaperone FlgA [Candidatus Baltobacteraceae bacterium]|jgi:flagella basal body P-ring formation protein FlgA
MNALRPVAVALLSSLLALAPVSAYAQQSNVQRVSGARIAALADRTVRGFASDAMHSYVAASTIPDQTVETGHVELHVGTPIETPSFVNVPVIIDIDGKADRTVFAGYRVQAYVETAVAARDLVTGSVLSAADITMARVAFNGRPGNGADVLIGRKVNATVLKGQPIPVEVTGTNQIVTAGSTVLLIVRDGGASVTADCIARSGGGLGDQVSVYNAQTNKALTGTVTAPATVELDLSGGDTL